MPARLAACTRAGIVFDMMDTTFFVSREKVVAQKQGRGMMHGFDWLFTLHGTQCAFGHGLLQHP